MIPMPAHHSTSFHGPETGHGHTVLECQASTLTEQPLYTTTPTHHHNSTAKARLYERCVRSDVYDSNTLSPPKLRLQPRNQQNRQCISHDCNFCCSPSDPYSIPSSNHQTSKGTGNAAQYSSQDRLGATKTGTQNPIHHSLLTIQSLSGSLINFSHPSDGTGNLIHVLTPQGGP